MKHLALLLVFLAQCGGNVTGPSGASTPAAAQLISTDIARFWTAFDKMQSASDTMPIREYLDGGTQGLKDLTSLRWKNAATLASMVYPRREYYASIRANTLLTASLEPQIRRIYSNLESQLADPVFPDVYFCIGGMGTGGTTSQRGLLIGTELFARAADSPVGTLSAWQQSVVRPIDILPAIVAHELVHYQQRYVVSQTLLAQAIREGVADFVGKQLSGRTINEHLDNYGLAHEAELWTEFRSEMNGTNIAKWLYNGGTSTAVSRPADLGYFIGSRIGEAYYAKEADKRKALIDLLRITDFGAFLTASGYDPK